ncbi:MAG TPA: hypothetical protein VHC95_01595 [Opitutales bacterium]|nr:hypothetical protein [Opitutales bacterium]
MTILQNILQNVQPRHCRKKTAPDEAKIIAKSSCRARVKEYCQRFSPMLVPFHGIEVREKKMFFEPEVSTEIT